MKKLLLTSAMLLLSLCLELSAQTPITTWYIIPPTSGCNGVWAIDYSQAGCGSTYLFNPSFPVACGSFTGSVADTMFIQLCSMPCDLTVVDMNGNICGFCGTGTSTGVGTLSQEHIITTYPNPATSAGGWNVWIDEPGSAVTVNIYNAFGQLVSTQSSANAEQVFHVDASDLPAGTYFTEIMVNGATPYRQKLILTQ